MIKPFAHKGLERFFTRGSKAGIRPDHAGKLRRQLAFLNVTTGPREMDYSGWKLHPLSEDLAGQWSVWTSGNWWLTFTFEGGVSLVCFARRNAGLPIALNGEQAEIIYPDLTGGDKTSETFPFPEDVLADSDPDARFPAIAEAAKNLNQLRENRLNPKEWVDWVITPEEEAAGFPKRPVAKPGHEADLKKRTLTNLYNEPPAWLKIAHEALDKAVAAAYGWHDYTPEWTNEEILRRLLALNLERAKNQTIPPIATADSTEKMETETDADGNAELQSRNPRGPAGPAMKADRLLFLL